MKARCIGKRLGNNIEDALTLFRNLNFDIYVSPISSNKLFRLKDDDILPFGWGIEIGKALNFYAIKNSNNITRLSRLVQAAEPISKLNVLKN